MRTQLVMKWIPGLLATTLVAVACDKPPNPAAPKRAQFSVQDEKNSRITGGGKLDGGRDFATFGFNARFGQGRSSGCSIVSTARTRSQITVRPADSPFTGRA